MEKCKVLLGLTTTYKSDWRSKIAEIKKFEIKELALFPTCLGIEERQEFYRLLEETPVMSIPHVHIRNDMEQWEMEMLTEKYSTQVFNTHPEETRPLIHDLSRFKERIYVENVEKHLEEKDLFGFAGICLDFSHWESFNLAKGEGYVPKNDPMFRLIEKYPVGCSHISAIKSLPSEEEGIHDRHRFSYHMLESIKDLGYIRKYLKYIPEYASIELENSFEEQLEIKKYLEELINNQ
jgi:hypothetical protein